MSEVSVTPAKAGVEGRPRAPLGLWVPAFAGRTIKERAA